MRDLILALSCALACSAATAESGDISNMSCVERLDVPMYPPLAAAARISAGVVTTIHLGSGGTIDAITSELEAREPVRVFGRRTGRAGARLIRLSKPLHDLRASQSHSGFQPLTALRLRHTPSHFPEAPHIRELIENCDLLAIRNGYVLVACEAWTSLSSLITLVR